MTPTIPEILSATADTFGVHINDLLSASRERSVARPRMVAAYLAKTRTPLSTVQIGQAMGRDHTTIMHAASAVATLRLHDAEFDERVQMAWERACAAAGIRPVDQQKAVQIGEIVEALRGVARECSRAARLLEGLSKTGGNE